MGLSPGQVALRMRNIVTSDPKLLPAYAEIILEKAEDNIAEVAGSVAVVLHNAGMPAQEAVRLTAERIMDKAAQITMAAEEAAKLVQEEDNNEGVDAGNSGTEAPGSEGSQVRPEGATTIGERS